MRSVKKILTGGLLTAMLLAVCCPSADVQAGRKTIITEDDFNTEAMVDSYDSERWSVFSSGNSIKIKELKTPEKVMEFKGKNTSAESTVLMTKDWYWEIHSLTFDLYVPKNASWFGLDFVDIADSADYVGNFADLGDPMCYGSLKLSAEDDFGLPDTDWTSWGFPAAQLSDTWVRVKIVTEDAQTGRIYMAPKGQSFDESKGQEIILGEEHSFYNSNVVFADYAFCGYKLDNIVIETDTGVYEENFEDGEDQLLECITIEKDMSKFSFPIVESGGDRRMEFSGAASKERMIANTAIKSEDENLTDTEKVMETKAAVTFSKNTSEEIAYVFGMKYADSDPFSGTWAYIFSDREGRLVSFDENGQETVLGTNRFTASGKQKQLQMTLTKNGKFKVTENGKKLLECGGITEYAGYAGYAAKTDITGPVYLDNVEILNNIYKVIQTKSFLDDFSTDRLGSVGNSDYAVNAEAGVINVADGELVFDGCLDDTYFGAAYEYETYEMSFQLTSILATENMEERQNATAPDRWIGIDFGKENAATKTYGTYGMLLIRITHPEGAEEWKTAEAGLYKKEGTSTLTGEEFKVVKEIPASYFTEITYDGVNKQKEDIPEGAAVCFKLVAKEDSMSLYMKRADQTDYTLYLTLDHVDPTGYSAITCTGWTFWTLDNFEMKNTAQIFEEAPEVVIEEKATISLEERGLGKEDTGWAEEEKLNENRPSDSSGTMVIIVAFCGVIVAVTAAAVVLNKKKKQKPENKE